MSNPALVQNNFDADLPLIDRADGIWLWDGAGKDYIDACSGAVVTTIGHNNARVLAALTLQASRVTFTHRGAFTSNAAERLAETLAEATGYPGVWLVNSGSEAVEAALQFALQYYRETGRPERQQFLSHAQGYHGNTLGALSLSGHARRSVAGDLAFEWHTLPTPYPFGQQGDLSDADYSAALLAEVRRELERTRGTIAGVVIEAIGGATLGVTPPPAGYLEGVRALCTEFDVLMIVDEVMTGLGRAGAMLAVEHWGVRPDIVVVGKGLGSGYAPVAATLLNARLVSSIAEGSRRIAGGHTYAGNPLSAAVGLAVMSVLIDDQLIEKSQETSTLLAQALRSLAERHPIVVDVRGVGMMWGLELSPGGNPLAGAVARKLAGIALDHGLVVYAATGGFNDAIAIAPPLIISSAEIAELARRLDAALSALELELELELRADTATKVSA